MQIATTLKRQVVDITDEVTKQLPDGDGTACIFIKHTTAAITTADLDPGTDLDLLDALADLLPQKQWRHPHDSSHSHVSAHLLASLIGPNICVPYQNGQLELGQWQRIVLLEFDGPRRREITIK